MITLNALTNEPQPLFPELVIDTNGPGTILQDFQTLLEFIGTEGVPVTGKNKLFSAKNLAPLNDQMVNPIIINLSRPQQKSYSNLHGLYLLLRCSGISRLKKRGSKMLLCIDKDMLSTWESLNPTERFCSLLEAWLMRGNDSILGERHNAFMDVLPMFRSMKFLVDLPSSWLKTAGNHQIEDGMRFRVGLHNVALLEMFGFLKIKADQSNKGKGWRIQSVAKTEFGDIISAALISDLDRIIQTPEDLFKSDIERVEDEIGPTLRTLFPVWQNSLSVPNNEFREGTFIFITSWGKAWRRIAISSQMVFEVLGDAILDSFDFDNEHLYRFILRDGFGREQYIEHPYMEDGELSSTEVTIGSSALLPGDTMTYHYDFGDDWRFEVFLESIEENDKLKKPKILERHGAPPEQYPEWDGDEW